MDEASPTSPPPPRAPQGLPQVCEGGIGHGDDVISCCTHIARGVTLTGDVQRMCASMVSRHDVSQLGVSQGCSSLW